MCEERLNDRERLVCERCWELARREERKPFFIGPEGIDRTRGEDTLYARSANLWNDRLGEILHRFKYGGYLSLGERLARGLHSTFQSDALLRSADLLLPAPLTRARQAGRGFNQSVELARHLSRHSGTARGERLVRRRGTSRSQTKLSTEERRDNVRDVFRLRPGADVAGKKIVIVDDVVTTGATSFSLASVLLKSGAAEVYVLSVALAGSPDCARRR